MVNFTCYQVKHSSTVMLNVDTSTCDSLDGFCGIWKVVLSVSSVMF